MKRLFLLALIASPVFVSAQIWAGLSGGMSFTTVNPKENFSFEQSSRVSDAKGMDFTANFCSDITEKIRLMARLGYNQTSAEVLHRYIEVQGLENNILGIVSSKYLGLYLAPMWHKGNDLEFVYGLGFYSGFKISGTFTGDKWLVKDGKAQDRFKFKDVQEDSYRNMATGLFTTLGLNLNLSPRLQLNLNTDVVLFLNAKNLVFQDTGSVNEINVRLGMSYLFQKKDD